MQDISVLLHLQFSLKTVNSRLVVSFCSSEGFITTVKFYHCFDTFEESFLSQLHGTLCKKPTRSPVKVKDCLKFPRLLILHKPFCGTHHQTMIYLIVTDFDLKILKETAKTGSN